MFLIVQNLQLLIAAFRRDILEVIRVEGISYSTVYWLDRCCFLKVECYLCDHIFREWVNEKHVTSSKIHPINGIAEV